MTRTDRLAELLRGHIVGKDVLEVACGSADFSLSAAKTARSVHCIDLDDSRLDRAGVERAGVRFLPMDARQMSFPDGSFDTVVLYNAFYHVRSQWDEIERECRRVLREDGSVWVVGNWKLETGPILEAFGEGAVLRDGFLIARLPKRL